MSEFVLETKHLCKDFGSKHALRDFSLKIERGGVHALIGSNGAGKTTLFKMLLGFIAPSGGESFLLGQNSQSLSPDIRGRIGYVNDEHTLPDWLKVQTLHKMQKSYYPQWQEDVFQNVINNFDVDPLQKVSSLSRGERAGFNLAMALAQNPELLILDEPTLGLDVVAKQEFLDAILFSTKSHTTVLYCSHQMEEVERLADDLIIMEQGCLKIKCSPEQFSERVQHWIVDIEHQQAITARYPEMLSSRIIEDKFHFYVIDKKDSFSSELGLLGIRDAVSANIGLAGAVRAFLSKNHLGKTH